MTKNPRKRKDDYDWQAVPTKWAQAKMNAEMMNYIKSNVS